MSYDREDIRGEVLQLGGVETNWYTGGLIKYVRGNRSCQIAPTTYAANRWTIARCDGVVFSSVLKDTALKLARRYLKNATGRQLAGGA